MRSRPPVDHLISDAGQFDISFDPEAFDVAIRSQGVRLVHYRAMRCPVGMTDVSDGQRPHPDHSGCSNGFLHTKVGVVTGLFTSNSKHKNSNDLGYWDGSTVQVTLPRTYDEVEEALVIAPFDRFYLDEQSLTVTTWQLFTADESGYDRLKYPVVAVEELVDSRGERYRRCDDFEVQEGRLHWTGSRRPGVQLDVGPGTAQSRGCVCSIRYSYHPYYIVGQIVHELRVTQVQDQDTGERRLIRMPQSVVVHREYVNPEKSGDHQEVRKSIDADVMRNILGPGMGGTR